MIAAIVGHAKLELPEWQHKYLHDSKVWIAADGGAGYLRSFSRVPDLIIGDLDGISKEDLDFYQSKTTILKFDKDKDETDLELALNEIDKRFESIETIRTFQWADDRIDYMWSTLSAIRASRHRVEVFFRNAIGFILNQYSPELTIESANTKISVLSLEDKTTLESTGLKWPLDWTESETGKLSQSNVSTGKATLNLVAGAALVIRDVTA